MPKSFVMLGQRHPRYTIALALLVLGAYWFFFNDPPPPVTYKLNSDLKLRLDREERKYRDGHAQLLRGVDAQRKAGEGGADGGRVRGCEGIRGPGIALTEGEGGGVEEMGAEAR